MYLFYCNLVHQEWSGPVIFSRVSTGFSSHRGKSLGFLVCRGEGVCPWHCGRPTTDTNSFCSFCTTPTQRAVQASPYTLLCLWRLLPSQRLAEGEGGGDDLPQRLLEELRQLSVNSRPLAQAVQTRAAQQQRQRRSTTPLKDPVDCWHVTVKNCALQGDLSTIRGGRAVCTPRGTGSSGPAH